LNQVCLIRETKNTCSVGVPPGIGLGNTALKGPDPNLTLKVLSPVKKTLYRSRSHKTLNSNF